MKIGITGATGFVGKAMAAMAKGRGYTVVGFSRSAPPVGGLFEAAGKKGGALSRGSVQHSAASKRPPTGERDETRPFGAELCVEGCQALIHLAGENVFGLWTAEKNRRILQSRQEGTRNLVEAIARSKERPRVLVSASAIGIYGDTGEGVADESFREGTGFLAEVTQAWEREAMRASELGVRVATLRTGIVLGQNGGALAKMLPVFKLGLGGKLGDGRQWMSWIHLEDLCALALHCVENPAASGPINACAPEPVRNADFTRILAKTLNRPAFFSVPGFALKAGLGEFSRELLESKRVVPMRALELGFQYRFPHVSEALRDGAGQATPVVGEEGEL